MKNPLETVPAFVFCFDPADEFASVGGFDWFWSKDSALGAFDDACTSTHYDTDALQVLEVLVPVDVIGQGRPATTRFISDQADRGPGRGVVELLRERPAKAGASPAARPGRGIRRLVPARKVEPST